MIANAIKASDPAVTAQRWGTLVNAAGNAYIEPGTGRALKFAWVVPGYSMAQDWLFANGQYHQYLIQYNVDTGNLIGFEKLNGEISHAYTMTVDQNGAASVQGVGITPTVWSSTSPDQINARIGQQYVSFVRSDDAGFGRFVAETRAQRAADAAAARASAEREKSDFFANVMTGMAIVAQAAAETSQEINAQQSANYARQQSQNLAAARERERLANEAAQRNRLQQQRSQEQAAQLQAQAQAKAAAGNALAAQRLANAQRDAQAKAEASQREAARQSQIAAQQRVAAQKAQQAAAAVPAPSPAARPVTNLAQADTSGGQAAAGGGPRRRAYLEAVTVCTEPTGPNGNFACSDPLQRKSGHLKDMAGYRTPEDMVAHSRESCRDPRRLRSSSHLVWGCGFAATGNTGSMDRSAGIAIEDRQTYYCSEKETSCRRTEN